MTDQIRRALERLNYEPFTDRIGFVIPEDQDPEEFFAELREALKQGETYTWP